MKNFIAYYRVSTQRQGRSGLGLEAQQAAVAAYVQSVGGTILDGFTEIESGKETRNRPELKKALAAARKNKAVLIVAKLDRLARQLSFVSALLDTPGVEFRAADFPEANRMMIQMMAVFAEYERTMISTRTKAALAARRARGLPLGNLANLNRGGNAAAAANKANARAEAERLRPIIDTIKAAGITSVRGMADELNRRGYTTEGGNQWHPTSVNRVLQRLAA